VEVEVEVEVEVRIPPRMFSTMVSLASWSGYGSAGFTMTYWQRETDDGDLAAESYRMDISRK
jgi:hypothetical protein